KSRRAPALVQRSSPSAAIASLLLFGMLLVFVLLYHVAQVDGGGNRVHNRPCAKRFHNTLTTLGALHFFAGQFTHITSAFVKVFDYDGIHLLSPGLGWGLCPRKDILAYTHIASAVPPLGDSQ